jgi:hypothetical protein
LAGSVERDERLRLFLALRVPDGSVAELTAWQERELRGRLVPPRNLHVTLAFLGSRPCAELPGILEVLERVARAAEPASFEVTDYRETRSVGMLRLRDETGVATQLAERLHDQLAELGVYRRYRTSPSSASASGRGCARACRPCSGCRPTRLLSFHVCTRPGRCTRC